MRKSEIREKQNLRKGKSKGIDLRKKSFMIIDEDLYIKRMKTLPQNRMKEIAL